ncbi:MAG: PIG-L deacetylase family protein [Bacillota bacterium]
MKILYIFPHPDDESFGPAPAISRQRRLGYEVYLLTLTKGGATKERFKYGYSIEQMGEIRFNEMQEVAKTLDLSGLTVLDLPDSGLKEMDPREIERVVKNEIENIKPDVIVTYAVHGVSGFHDHIIIHGIVKRVFVDLKDNSTTHPQRLAFFTLNELQAKMSSGIHQLKFSQREDIDCVVAAEEIDMENFHKALDCYKTYKDIVENTNVKNSIGSKIYFEIFQEKFDPPLTDICASLS